jgi:4-hydroxy-3-methylbut-2-enyl diphosphate reductase
MKKFDIPDIYRSSFISGIKHKRNLIDPRKKDFTPAFLNFGPVVFIIARHFGFCYGVENAIDIAYKTIEENTGKRIYLLSEMIHNPGVNSDLLSKGVRFLMDTSGNQIISWDELKRDDIVIIPAFGTTMPIQKKLNDLGINMQKYNTTCPFVEKVWNRSEQLGNLGYTIIIHGKHYHEETRATFSHAVQNSPSVIIRNIDEAVILGSIIEKGTDKGQFYKVFKDKYSQNFNPESDLVKIGVVNQTTMLAEETQAIASHLKSVMEKKYGKENLKDHFADTRDTLCYATNDNQDATYKLLQEDADFAVVVGGFNSSNTSHIVELCENKFQTYFISSQNDLLSKNIIKHFNINAKQEIFTENYIPEKPQVKIVLTSGASCPDSVIDDVIQRFVSFFNNTKNLKSVIEEAFKNFS